MTFEVITLGCKVNSCESAAISERFSEDGFTPAESGAPADVYIVNSCAVTAMSEKKARQVISRCKRAGVFRRRIQRRRERWRGRIS